MFDLTVDGLDQLVRGRVVRSHDADYDEARSLYNGMIDKRPRAVAQCADVADVAAAVRWAATHDVPLAVRGGGHNGAGLAGVDDGLVVDLTNLRGIHVDPTQRTARVGGGCTSGDVDHATHAFGLAVPFGIVSTTGVGGLTLGGGTGYLTRQHGLTIDNLLEADIVLADGRIVTASPEEHPDLFWAIRGGGGNFGVVVSFLFRAHPVDRVYAGPAFWDISDAPAVMAAYRDFLPGAPEELACFVGLKSVPTADPFPIEYQGKHACALISCFNGSVDEGAAALAPLRDELPEPLFDWTGEMAFPDVQALFDPLLRPGMQWYWRGDFLRDLPDAAIAAHVQHALELRPGALSMMHLYPIDGAVHRVAPGDTAWHTRDATWSMVIAGVHADPDQAAEVTSWTRSYWDELHPYSAEGGYVNFMMGDGTPDRLRATYGANYDRLVSVKTEYDPTNLFRCTQNIEPGPTP